MVMAKGVDAVIIQPSPSDSQELSNEQVFRTQPLSILGKLKVGLGLFTFFPVKLMLLICHCIIFIPLLYLILFCYSSTKKTLKRRALKSYLHVWGRTFLFILGYVHIKERGAKKKLPTNEPVILVSNHVSWIDGFYFLQEYGCSFVAKGALGDLPFVGRIAKELGTIFVNMRGPEEAKIMKGGKKNDAKERIIQSVKKEDWNIESDAPLMIFPEGTTSNGKSIISFKLGAFLPGCPVVPHGLRYPYWFYDPSYSSVGLLYCFLMTMCQGLCFLETHRGDVYYPSEEEKSDPVLYSKNVRQVIASSLQVGTNDKSFSDMCQFLVEIGFIKPRADRKIHPLMEEARENKGGATSIEGDQQHKEVATSCHDANKCNLDEAALEEGACIVP